MAGTFAQGRIHTGNEAVQNVKGYKCLYRSGKAAAMHTESASAVQQHIAYCQCILYFLMVCLSFYFYILQIHSRRLTGCLHNIKEGFKFAFFQQFRFQIFEKLGEVSSAHKVVGKVLPLLLMLHMLLEHRVANAADSRDSCRTATVIFISHRLSTTRFADRIFLFAGGELCEQGSHGDLIAMDGKYAEMFRMQAEKYRRGEEAAAE